jgi:glycosyltransferase involved in cell wall biosynthesis
MRKKNLAPWFLSSSFFVYPTAIGLSLMHAYGYGLPVITHDNIHAHGPEFSVFENHKTGILYKQNDSQDLLNKISLLLDNIQLKDEIKKNVLSIVNEKYNTKIMSDNFIKGVLQISNPQTAI